MKSQNNSGSRNNIGFTSLFLLVNFLKETPHVSPHVSVGSVTLPTLGRKTNNALSPKTIGSEKTFAFNPKPDNRFNSKHVF